MKRQLLFLASLFCSVTVSWAAIITVGPGGPPTYNFANIQDAVTASFPGDFINIAPGTYVESNILVDKSITIQGIGATRDLAVIVPPAYDGHLDNAFTNAQNGFIIKAHGVVIRKLTIDGNGNPALIAQTHNFRAGIVTLDASQSGGGTWNNLHVDDVFIKFTWRRGISVFPRNVSGTLVENSRVDYVAYNQGMYLAGHSQVLNNAINHCFQGIVVNPDVTTPAGLFKINGNVLNMIGNFAGCFGYPNGQPRAIQFDPVDPTYRTVEIKNNVIDDNGSAGLVGAIGIYTRRADIGSIIENNAITLNSGSSWSVSGGLQSVGLLLGWSYEKGFTAKQNQVSTTGTGIGIMVFACGSPATPLILDGNELTSTLSQRADTADGTGIYIANQYLYYHNNKNSSNVKILNHNVIYGFVRGIDVLKAQNSNFPLDVKLRESHIKTGGTGSPQCCLHVTGGTIDAGTMLDPGENQFFTSGPGSSAVLNGQAVPITAYFNDWGSANGPTIASLPAGDGGAILGTGATGVLYNPWGGGPITSIDPRTVCVSETTVDIPIKVSRLRKVGSFSLTFGFIPAQLTAPITIVSRNPAFDIPGHVWDPFVYTTDPLLLAAGIFKVSGFGTNPDDGISIPDGETLLTVRFTLGTITIPAIVTLNENMSGTALEYTTVAPGYYPYGDIPKMTNYYNGSVTVNQLHKISGRFTYYNASNTSLASGITVGLYQNGSLVGSNYVVNNPTGYYEFPNTCPGTYEIRATSNTITSGAVNTTDAAQVNYWGPNPYDIEKVRFYAGDVKDNNLFLNSSDAQRIQRNFVYGTPFDRAPWTFWKTGETINVNAATATYPVVVLPVNSDKTANMYGLCTGDFNRSFNPSLKKSPSQSLNLVYGRSVLVGASQEFELPIRVVNPSSIGAISLILNFPPDLMEVKDVVMNGTGGQLDWNVEGNELRIGWNSTIPISFSEFENLLTLKLKTTAAFTNWASIRLYLASDPLNELADQQYEVIGNAVLSVDVVDASPNGIADHASDAAIRLQSYPNPVTDGSTIAYYLPFAGKVTLEIKNALGESVLTLINEMQTQGEHSMKLDAANLAAGVYFAQIRLNNGNGERTGTIKLVKTR